MMPKIPTGTISSIGIKSPPKSPVYINNYMQQQQYQTSSGLYNHQQQSNLPRTGQSPPKIIQNKSKNRL